MKGIAHFAMGIAAASCFPEAVQAGADGNPLFFILGGAFGLLPDTMDFKFYRFFHRHDVELIPDPNNPDPQLIAGAVAHAVNKAYESRKPVRLKLDTIRLGSDLWQQYEVAFDVAGRRVCASLGPIVNTSGAIVETPQLRGGGSHRACPGGDEISASHDARLREYATPRHARSWGRLKKTASAPLLCGVKLDYEAVTKVDILDGPSFQMERLDDGRVMPRFMPWHREWSHSVVIGLLFALIGTLVWNWLAGAIIFCAYALHVLVDQLGFMGSNYLFPFSRIRSEGMKLLHSNESLPNLAAVWLSCLLIFWNLYCGFSWQMPHFNLARLIFYGAAIPGGAYFALRRGLARSD